MDRAEQEWRKQLVAAAERAADKLRRLDDPHLTLLLGDIQRLRDRLLTEIANDDSARTDGQQR